MKNSTEIKAIMNENRTKINTLKKEAEALDLKLYKMIDGLKLKEKINVKKFDKDYSMIDTLLTEKNNEIKRLETVDKYLVNNWRVALYHEVMPIYCEVLKKYAGKRHGEKTAQKIKNEIMERSGYRVYIANTYSYSPSTIRISINPPLYSLDIEFSVHHNETDVLVDNVIQAHEPTDFYMHGHTKYYENIEETIEKQERLKAKIDTMKKELERLEMDYNSDAVEGMARY